MPASTPRPRSTLRLVGAWLGLAGLATAATSGTLLLLQAPEAQPAVTAEALHDSDGIDTVDIADADADADADSGDGVAPVEGDMLGEEIEVPVVEQPETLDPERELEMAPAERPEGLGAVASNPEPEIGVSAIERIVGPRPWVVHKMAPLETVDQVAHRYGVLPSALRRWNGLQADTRKLRRGARLKVKARQIPPRRLRLDYVVQEGDTWWSIATRYGVDSQELRAANWDTPRRVVVGEKLSLWIDPVVFHWVVQPPGPVEDAIAGIRRGAVGIGPPQNGRLVNGVEVPPGEGYSRKMLPSSYGTTHAVSQLVLALTDFHDTSGYAGEILLGSMSRRHGGPLEGHRSHQTGRDVDIRLPLRADVPTWFPLKPWRVDWVALWHLLDSLAATGHVQVVFLDYKLQKQLYKAATDIGVTQEERRRMLQWPRGDKAHLGIVRHSRGHERHVHVRFDCGELETECVSTDGLPENDE